MMNNYTYCDTYFMFTVIIMLTVIYCIMCVKSIELSGILEL